MNRWSIVVVALLAVIAVELAIIAARLPAVQDVRIVGLGDRYRIWGLPVAIEVPVSIKQPIAVWAPFEPVKVNCVRGCR